jgi:hypothetical protein
MMFHPPSSIEAKLQTIASFSRLCRGLETPCRPLEMTLELSNVCDLKCAMCTEFSQLSPKRFSTLQGRERGFLSSNNVDKHLRGLLEGALLVLFRLRRADPASSVQRVRLVLEPLQRADQLLVFRAA